MNLLAIDTSTEYASLSLSINNEIKSVEQPAQREHAKTLLPLVARLLAEAGLKLAQLDGIVYGRGPGSFTGLRIACSVAKGLAYGHDLPLYPVSSLSAIAAEVYLYSQQLDFRQGAREQGEGVYMKYMTEAERTCNAAENSIAKSIHEKEDSLILAMLDARMNQVYWASFSGPKDTPEEAVNDAAEITLTSAKPIILAGAGFELYLPQLKSAIREKIIKTIPAYPKAYAMIQLVTTGQIKAISAAEAMPVYIRNQITQGDFRG